MIAAVVPAAGRSSRMGRPKLLLDFEGESLIRRVVTALRGGGADRIVVVPPVDSPEAEPRPASVLLTPGDFPGLAPGLVARLLAVAHDHPDRVVIPTHDGHHGH